MAPDDGDDERVTGCHIRSKAMAARENAFCALCREAVGDDAASWLARRSDGLSYVCGGCLADAILALYARGGRLPTLETRLRELFLISAETEAEHLRRHRESLAARHRQLLIEARDSEQVRKGEGDKQFVTVCMTRYMRDRCRALADEADVSLSSWIRSAIWTTWKLMAQR
jgi:hypothetical protein